MNTLPANMLRIIERHVARRSGHERGCRCMRCAAARVRAKRDARLRLVLILYQPGIQTTNSGIE